MGCKQPWNQGIVAALKKGIKYLYLKKVMGLVLVVEILHICWMLQTMSNVHGVQLYQPPIAMHSEKAEIMGELEDEEKMDEDEDEDDETASGQIDEGTEQVPFCGYIVFIKT